MFLNLDGHDIYAGFSDDFRCVFLEVSDKIEKGKDVVTGDKVAEMISKVQKDALAVSNTCLGETSSDTFRRRYFKIEGERKSLEAALKILGATDEAIAQEEEMIQIPVTINVNEGFYRFDPVTNENTVRVLRIEDYLTKSSIESLVLPRNRTCGYTPFVVDFNVSCISRVLEQSKKLKSLDVLCNAVLEGNLLKLIQALDKNDESQVSSLHFYSMSEKSAEKLIELVKKRKCITNVSIGCRDYFSKPLQDELDQILDKRNKANSDDIKTKE